MKRTGAIPPFALAYLAASVLVACGDLGPPVAVTDAGVEANPSLSPDGAIAYEEVTGPGNSDIYVMTPGEAPTNLTADSPANDTEPAFSPDGQSIAFRSGREGGGIFVMSATGGAARRVVDEGFNPTWTPDGTEILYATASIANPYVAPGASRISAVNVESGQRRQVSQGYALQPRMSPSGRRVAYTSLGDGNAGTQRDVWTMNADGSGGLRITDDAAVDWSPAWSPDGRYLYFASDRDSTMKVWRVPINQNTGIPGSEPELVTADAGAQVRGQITTSEGGGIGYVDLSLTRTLYRVALDPATGQPQGEPAQVSDASISPAGFAVSPDGQWVALVTGDGRQEDVYLMNTDGTGLQQLTNDRFRDRGPTWSADGAKIAFRSDRPLTEGRASGGFQHYQMNRDGTGFQRTSATSGSALAPVFTPDGRSIATVSTLPTGGSQAFVMNAGGAALRPLFSSPNTLSLPVWAPDNRRFAYRESTGSVGRSYILDVARPDAEPEPLPEMNFAPTSWSPDGRRIAGNQVFSDRPGLTLLYDVAAREFTPLTDAGTEAEWLANGRLLMVLSDDASKIQLVDVESQAASDVTSVAAPNSLSFELSRDNTFLYYLVSERDADVYQMGG